MTCEREENVRGETVGESTDAAQGQVAVRAGDCSLQRDIETSGVADRDIGAECRGVSDDRGADINRIGGEASLGVVVDDPGDRDVGTAEVCVCPC